MIRQQTTLALNAAQTVIVAWEVVPQWLYLQPTPFFLRTLQCYPATTLSWLKVSLLVLPYDPQLLANN